MNKVKWQITNSVKYTFNQVEGNGVVGCGKLKVNFVKRKGMVERKLKGLTVTEEYRKSL